MKHYTKALAMVMVAAAAMWCSAPASAQVKFGLKLGTAINNLKFSSSDEALASLTDSGNRAGFLGGAMVEFTVPIVGLCFDGSVLYVHRTSSNSASDEAISRDYIDIPINLKYKFSFPIVSSLIKPYVTTGPSFAFLTSKKAIQDAIESKSTDISWNFGLGVELMSHVQVSASYGFSLGSNVSSSEYSVDGKNRYWTVTAAYLF